jgi:membrane-bound metal-dependent hydrolase YbcI (DUF457 family)
VPRLSIDKNIRNAAIVVLLAALIYASHTADIAYGFVTQLISLAFLGAFAWVVSRVYRDHRIALHSLGARNRYLLYGAIGVAALTLTATNRLWGTGLGTIGWLVLLAGCAYAAYVVFRSAREY